MGASWFTSQTDSVLAAGSANFANLISADAEAYGLTPEMAALYAAVNAAWQAAYAAARAPATRTRSQIVGKNDARDRMRRLASGYAKLISGTASVTDEQRLRLGLSVRAPNAPLPPPGTPNTFVVTLWGNGALRLKWKCKNPKGSVGTMYQVYRRVGATGAFAYLGGGGEKTFTDATIPAGAASITYQVRAVRSTAAGEWAEFNVNFGAAANGLPPAFASPDRRAAAPTLAA